MRPVQHSGSMSPEPARYFIFDLRYCHPSFCSMVWTGHVTPLVRARCLRCLGAVVVPYCHRGSLCGAGMDGDGQFSVIIAPHTGGAFRQIFSLNFPSRWFNGDDGPAAMSQFLSMRRLHFALATCTFIMFVPFRAPASQLGMRSFPGCSYDYYYRVRPLRRERSREVSMSPSGRYINHAMGMNFSIDSRPRGGRLSTRDPLPLNLQP
ncbi:hypothetical protein K440DRAFT_618930 [Wilcoxina mikolae CBS 423.85]|nr:hypothetical protein K440DRAFT_618930 [Wilcoxina mikolae CBS 423.85]